MKNNYLYRKIFGLLIVALFAVSCSSDGLAVGGEEGDIIPLRKGCLSSKALFSQIDKGEVPTSLSGYDEDSQEVFSRYPAGAKVVARYVKENGTGDGSSVSKASGNVKTVLDGITDASADKIYAVLIEPGTYAAGEAMGMKNYVAIIGKCSGIGEEVIVLSGGGKHQVFSNSSIDRTATLHGVLIAGGKALFGGGMYTINSSPLLNRVTFSKNTATYGGGLYNGSDSHPLLTEVTFSENTADWKSGTSYLCGRTVRELTCNPVTNRGGGMFNLNDTSSLTLIGVTFSKNTTTGGYGGGLHNGGIVNITNAFFSQNRAFVGGGVYNDENSKSYLSEVIFSKNKAQWAGGMILHTGSSTVLVNAAFFSNRAEFGYGGGMWLQNASAELNSSTFLGNSSRCGGGGILSKGSSVHVNNTIMWGNVNERTTYEEGGDEVIVTLDPNVTCEECKDILSPVTGAALGSGAKQLSDNGFFMSASIIHNVTNSVTPGLLSFNYYSRGQMVEGAIPTTSSAVNQGLYVRRAVNVRGTQAIYYYSADNANWYVDPELNIAYPKSGIPGTPSPADAMDLTATDITGAPRIGRPDIGAFEAR